MTTPQRIIDANGNRAREAMRVLEEAARFLLDDPTLSREFKQMRHALSQAVAGLPNLIHHRDTPGDVGTTISTPTEQQRSSLADVVNAAASRLSEALRAIEEYAKVLADKPAAAELAQVAERLRYAGYDATKRLSQAIDRGTQAQWRLCLLLTESLCTHMPWQDVLEQAVSNGVDAVQVREKQKEDGALLDHVRAVIAVVNHRVPVIVNDRPDIAMLAGAQGVHLGQTDLGPAEVRKIVGDTMRIGVSTSSLEDAHRAQADGADYCGVGPMFETTTKHKPVLAGPDYLGAYLAWDRLPHLAIGGITPSNVDALAQRGCRGIAVSSAICSAKEPGNITASFSAAID